MSAEVLRPACELAFVVAREGAEATDPVEPPASMRSFLYVDDLPRRAIAAAQQVIEEDSDFRHRVALRADEGEIGRAGYLWLRRPTGWATEFESLANEFEGDAPAVVDGELDPSLEAVYKGLTSEPIELITAQPPEPDPDREVERDRVIATASDPEPTDVGRNGSIGDTPIATVTPIAGAGEPLTIDHPTASAASLGLAAVTNTDHAETDPIAPRGFDTGSGDDRSLETGDGGFEAADALESELDSLRGLVARLASERETAEPTPGPVEAPAVAPAASDDDTTDEPLADIAAFAAPPPAAGSMASIDTDGLRAESEGLRSELEAAHHELYLAQADLTIARQEREESQRLQSEALKRQVQLEKELATIREHKAELESELSSNQARVISVEERLGRFETQLADGDRERANVQAQLDTMTLERNQIRDERASLRAERDELRASLDDIAEKTGGVDLVELVESHETAKAELETTGRELARIIGQAENYEEQLSSLTAETAAIKSERIDLRARLGEAETALDVVTTQYDALKIDAERNAAELGARRAENDGLQSQVAELQVSLSESLQEQADGRQRNDADRRSLNELRVEYDVVVARLADLEEGEQTARGKLDDLIVERDNLLAGRDELLEERGQLRADLATAVGERGTAQEQLAELQERLRVQETELQMERRQREELANRLLELDDLAERAAAEQQALTEERDALQARSATIEQELEAAAAIAQERDRLANELTEMAAANEQAVEAVRLQLDQSGEEIERIDAARASLETQLTAANTRLGETQAELGEAELVRRERDELAEEIAQARARHDEAMKALRYDLDEAAREAERLRTAQADAEEQLTAVRATLADTERERDEVKGEQASASAATDELRADLDARDGELGELRSALAAAQRETEEATVALQIKESELRTVLDARGADAAEIEGLRGNLADAAADIEQRAEAAANVETQANERAALLAERDAELANRDAELATRDAELAAREAELADLHKELTELRRQLAERAEAPAEISAFAQPGPDELASTRSELEEANAELDNLRNELAVARVELASTTAELEAREALPGSDIGAPPVDPLLDAGDAREDELDSMAAEVRSALRGPSMLDSLAGATTSADLDAEPTDVADEDPSAEVAITEAGGDLMEVVEAVDQVPDEIDLTDAATDAVDGSPELIDLVDAAGGEVGEVIDDADLDPTAPMPVPAMAEAFDDGPGPGADQDDDELDTVSELISMKVNSFGLGDMPSLRTAGEDDIDLAAELARTPTELTSADIDEAMGGGSPPSILGDHADPSRPPEQADLGVRRAGGSRRRRIDIPGDITDDEVAVARFVVSSPDVVLLVDGDSVAQLGWPSLPVAQQRDALVTYLSDLSTTSGAAPDVVFDGRLGDDDSLPASRAVRIRLSTPPTPPTAALDELVDAYPEQWPIALVTDDIELASTAADRGAAVLNNGQLLDLFIAE